MILIRHRFIVAFFCAFLGLAAAAGCKGNKPKVDPMVVTLTTYKSSVEPPIQQSEEIAKAFVQIVLDDNAAPDPDRVAQRIEKDVLPAAKRFLTQIKTVAPEDEALKALHEHLVKAATLRYEGYGEIIEGYKSNDLDKFSAGQKKITDSKIEEDNYIARADRMFKAYGMELMYFAAPPAIGQ